MSELQNSYDSIAAAAAAMGFSASRLRWAKKKGAPGFRGSRVYPVELAPWLEAQEEIHSADGTPIDKEGWEIRRFRLQCDRFEIENQKLRDDLWLSSDVRASWLLHMRQARQVLLQMATDLAPRIAGRPALECEQLLNATVQEALGKLRGNPYGDIGACKCSGCGKPFALVDGQKISPVPPEAKGNEESKNVGVAPGGGVSAENKTDPEPGAGSPEANAEKGAGKKGVGRRKGKGRKKHRHASARARPGRKVPGRPRVSKDGGGKPGARGAAQAV